MGRTLAIGDIHGCSATFDHLLAFVQPMLSDRIITLGDYIDRGPDSKGVLDRLIRLGLNGNWICLRGNHEMMMLGADGGERDDLRFWLSCGGVETLESYVPEGETPSLDDIPENHWFFLKHKCVDWYETENHLFVHANLHPHKPMEEQSSQFIHWEFLRRDFCPHQSGKTMICGHSEQRNGIPLKIPGAICIDTWAYAGQWLTCLNVDTGEYWQANELGDTRTGMLPEK